MVARKSASYTSPQTCSPLSGLSLSFLFPVSCPCLAPVMAAAELSVSRALTPKFTVLLISWTDIGNEVDVKECRVCAGGVPSLEDVAQYRSLRSLTYLVEKRESSSVLVLPGLPPIRELDHCLRFQGTLAVCALGFLRGLCRACSGQVAAVFHPIGHALGPGVDGFQF